MNKVIRVEFREASTVISHDQDAGRSMNGLPYYKAYPRDFFDGTLGMDCETKGIYRLVLDMIYMQGGRLPDDAGYISGLLGCSKRKWSSARNKLIEAGKLTIIDGLISNYRAIIELENQRKLRDKMSENASSPRKNNNLQKPKPSHTETETETDKKVTPKPPFRGHERFQEFWDAYGHKVGLGAAEKAFDRAAKIEDPTKIISAAREFSKSRSGADPRFTPHPATWLNGKRWADAAPTKSSATIRGGRRGEMTSMGWIPDVE